MEFFLDGLGDDRRSRRIAVQIREGGGSGCVPTRDRDFLEPAGRDVGNEIHLADEVQPTHVPKYIETST